MSDPESLTLFGYNGVLYADSVQKRIKRLKELDQLRKEFLEELEKKQTELEAFMEKKDTRAKG